VAGCPVSVASMTAGWRRSCAPATPVTADTASACAAIPPVEKPGVSFSPSGSVTPSLDLLRRSDHRRE
jgi:hypothetical protein